MLTPTSLATKFCYFAMNNFVTKSTYSMTTLHYIAHIFSIAKDLYSDKTRFVTKGGFGDKHFSHRLYIDI